MSLRGDRDLQEKMYQGGLLGPWQMCISRISPVVHGEGSTHFAFNLIGVDEQAFAIPAVLFI